MRSFLSRFGMRRSRLGLLALLISLGVVASAQNNSDPLQALKDSMSNGDQQSLLEGVLGKEGNSSDKKDNKLKSPETVQPSRIKGTSSRGRSRTARAGCCGSPMKTRSCARTTR